MEDKPLILVADDQPVIQTLFSMNLEKLGYGYILTSDGEEAVEKLRNNDITLVFTDIQMPKMNGYEAATKMRELGFTAPIIAVTASVLESEKDNCLAVGMNDILMKPFVQADLKRIIKKWMYAEESAEEEEVSEVKDSVFDVQTALEAFMHSREALCSLFPRFIARTRAQIDGFPALREAGDWESARQEFHVMQGSALTLGGVELGRKAAFMEALCIAREEDKAEAAFCAVCEALTRFEKKIEEFIQDSGSNDKSPS